MAAGEADGVNDASQNNPEVTNDETSKEPTELEKYWKAVRDNPSDFTGWTYLLQYVEQEGNIDNAREAFDAFLGRYPYCYGYWKKYADTEKKNEDSTRVEQVFEAGLMAIPLSIDLWVHYLNYTINKLESSPDKEALIRRLFERAIAAAGTDFRSDKLWEMFIYWERDNKLLKNVTELYDRVLAIPTQLYSHHFENFTEHVKSHHPKDILRLDEFLKIRKDVVASKEATKKDGEEGEDVSDGGPPGEAEEAPPGLDAVPPGTDAANTQVTDAEVPMLRDKIIEMRCEIHKKNEQEVSRRWTFEEGIRRPYFHVKPLEKAQLKNWKDYLNFEIQNGTHERVVVLFERCMIACALYEEYWLKYASYMENHSLDGVRNIFRRACSIHLQKKPNIHLAWASFEERQGNNDTALDILRNLELLVPGLVLVALRRISMERRHGNFQTIEELYQKYISEAEEKDVKSLYTVKYARYLAKVLANVEKARTVLNEAIENDPDNHKLLLQLVDLEFQQPTMDESAILNALEKAIGSTNMDLEHRVAFSQRKLEFLEDFGSSVSRITEAYDEHQKLVKEQQESKKRKNEEDKDEEPSSKKAKTSATEETTAVTNGSGDSSQSTQPATSSMDSSAASYGYNHSWPGYGYGYQGWGGYGGGYYGSQ